MRAFSAWVGRVSTGWAALAGVLVFAVFMAWVLPWQAERAEAYSAGVGSVDTSFWYTAEDVYTIAEAYGEAGRRAYVTARLTFDVIFPLGYTFFLATALSWIFRRAFPSESWVQLANLAPFLGMVFDFLENLTISFIMVQFPRRLMGLAALMPWLTLLKWIFVNGSFVLLFVGLGGWLVKKLRKATKL